MDLNDYNVLVKSVADKHIDWREDFVRKYEHKLNSLKNHPEKSDLEEKLIPSMGFVLPFVISPMSFSNSVFGKILSISKEFDDEVLAKELKYEFSNCLSERLDGARNIIYNNAQIIFENVKERLDLIGNGEKYQNSMKDFQDNLQRRSLLKENVEWLNSFPCVPIPLRISKEDYCFHITEAYSRATDNFSQSIEMYKFDKNLSKKQDSTFIGVRATF